MPALIQELISAPDNFEIVGDQIAAILKVEAANQEALALAAGEADPTQWKLRVFRERASPWEAWVDAPGPDEIDEPHVPIVNVRFDTDSVDERASNIVERQKYSAIYHVDVFGYGKSTGTEDGHDSGDFLAAAACHRAMRLVRRILMAGHYTYLALGRGENQIVWKRMIRSRTVFQPQLAGRAIQHIVGGRIAFHVDFNEFSPQVQGVLLELIELTLKSAETGEVLLKASFGLQPDSAVVAPDGLSIALTYPTALDPGSVEAASAFTLYTPDAVAPGFSTVGVAGPVVTLSGFDAAILQDQLVLLDYLPGSSPILTLDGNAVAQLSELQVTNHSTA